MLYQIYIMLLLWSNALILGKLEGELLTVEYVLLPCFFLNTIVSCSEEAFFHPPRNILEVMKKSLNSIIWCSTHMGIILDTNSII